MTTPLASLLFRLSGEAAALYLRGAAGFEAHLTPEGWLILSGEPVADLNVAMIHGGGASEERLREFGARIRRRDLPTLLLMTTVASDQLAATAQEYGLAHVGAVPLMIFEPVDDLPVPLGYPAEVVSTEAGRVEAMDVVARAFRIPFEIQNRACGPPFLDAPGVRLFVARREGEAVCAVTTTRTGTTVGIWSMGTPPEHQRKGAGRALLSQAINQQRVSGAKLFYLYATEQGLPLYRSLGFRAIVDLPVWVRGQSTQVPG